MSPLSHAVGPSVRSLLLRPLLWSWLIGLLAAVAGAYYVAKTSVDRAFDRGLQDEVSALAAKVSWSDRGPLLDLSRQTMELLTWDRDDRNGFVMIDSEGNPLAGDATVPIPEVRLRAASFEQPRLFDGRHDHEPIRGAVFSVTSPMLDRTVSVVVVETKRRRAELMRDVQLSIMLPALLLGTLTFGLINWGIRRGLQPLREIAAEVARRDSHDWRPLPMAQVPKEAAPLIERINMLLSDMEQAIELQRRFVADAAHQLRTPVAGIRILAQTLAQELEAFGPTSKEDAELPWRTLLAQLGRSSDRLSRLIGQLLSLARSETALSVDAEHERLDVVALVREAAEPFALQAMRRGRALCLDAPAVEVMANAHPIWLGEVLNNLLDNAIRYGGPNIQVSVRALPEGGAEIMVEDNGVGVAEDQIPNLFQPFWRGERADLRNDDGTGLGLTIAQEVVVRLGGTLRATSRPEVSGLRFTLTLAA